ncbi:pathogenicity island protein [Staphylococcus saprophyticus]|uniref:pathogenicity island protein n=1 Tax=Staphylococcus saprophyticus TaxID=29385 RepID=UPI000853B590|nr:pathogenicity island protein [Staphylococcus saprophyticus]MDW4180182.1 pathogenicity island protein [Staphylococcus saprophyticus]MDW4231046.1 pathogenicity island protein [Staphylococcus saprophyticus]MDW4342537.1 pathogenicity island protein [Staphylococcus saprophyticus]MDW4386954.1 pathogenicity island protein [Staphylococcus saprophyticus]MDW4473531.1 pathogenicity island protein [Staphylococcus saprophyticus]
MKLKRCKSVLLYKEEMKITEYELLTSYNPQFINSKIRAIQEQIDAMYHLNTSHMMCDDVAGVITVSYPLEKLVIWIIDQKEELNRFKTNSTKKLNLLKKLISNYTAKEQNEVMRYFKYNGSNKPIKTIDKLQVDLYKVHHHKRLERNKQRQKESEVIYQNFVVEVKESLNNEREELVV